MADMKHRPPLSCDHCDQRFYTPGERVMHVRFEHRDGKTSDEYWGAEKKRPSLLWWLFLIALLGFIAFAVMELGVAS